MPVKCRCGICTSVNAQMYACITKCIMVCMFVSFDNEREMALWIWRLQIYACALKGFVVISN